METQESILAREAAIHFECKKDGLRQTQDGGVKVTFNINPNDMPKQLYTDPMGTRYIIALVALNEDETPKLVHERPVNSLSTGLKDTPRDAGEGVNKPVSHAGEAKLLVKDPLFREYQLSHNIGSELTPEDWMKYKLGIKSCSELIDGSSQYSLFTLFRRDFNAWKTAYEQEQFYTA